MAKLIMQHQKWVHWVAFGFGSGTAPKAPGTMGSLAALITLPMFAWLSWPGQVVWVLVAFAVGVWICEQTVRDLGVDDHPGIVWDEFVGIWLVFIAVPLTWETLILGFVLFRIFDVLKPWPIRWLDRRVKGGFGVMIDDVLAGIFAWILLQLWLLSPWSATLLG